MVANTINLLRPYCPPYGKGNQYKHFLYRSPLVFIANTVLRSAGFRGSDLAPTPAADHVGFTNPGCRNRSLAPTSTISKKKALLVDAYSLYYWTTSPTPAVTNSSKDEKYRIPCGHNNWITSVARALDHRDALFGAFCHMNKVHEVAPKNCEFAYRYRILTTYTTHT